MGDALAPEPRFCSSCGAPILPRSRFCGRCGHGLAAARAGGRGWMIACLVAVAVAAAAIGWLVLRRPPGLPTRACPAGACPTFDAVRGALLEVEGTDPLLDRVRLAVPPGALAAPVEIRITPAPAGARPPRVADAWDEADPTLAGPVVRLEPDGTRFERPVTITLPYDPAAVPAGRGVAVLTWGGGRAERLPAIAIDPARGTVTAELHHFSDAVAAVDPGPLAIFVGAEPSPPELLLPTSHPHGDPAARTCDTLLPPAIAQAVAAREYTLTVDPATFWAERGIHPHERTMLWYLYAEDGGAMSSIVTGKDQPIAPIRTGHEVALLRLLKAEVRGGRRPTPDDVLGLALRAGRRDDGRADLATAAVTAHNVIRAIARADKWIGDLIDDKGRPCPPAHPDCGFDPATHTHFGHPPSDPMMPVFRDLLGAESVDDGPTFLSLIGARKADAATLMGAFDPRRGVFAPLPGVDGNTIHNGGAHYYHWIGMVGQIFHGRVPTTLGLLVEFFVTKLPSDPKAGAVQGQQLLLGRELAGCIEADPPRPPPCPEPPRVRQKCPWTPEGYTVEECIEGYCWDGGYLGTGACKQIETPPGAGRNDLRNIICPDGTVPRPRPPCGTVHVGCEPASTGPPSVGASPVAP